MEAHDWDRSEGMDQGAASKACTADKMTRREALGIGTHGLQGQ